jgi:hypothetical protein
MSVMIPANTYTGQDKDVPTAAVVNYLVTSSAVSDDLAYQMTKLIYESLPELATAHAAGKEIKLETAASGITYLVKANRELTLEELNDAINQRCSRPDHEPAKPGDTVEMWYTPRPGETLPEVK